MEEPNVPEEERNVADCSPAPYLSRCSAALFTAVSAEDGPLEPILLFTQQEERHTSSTQADQALAHPHFLLVSRRPHIGIVAKASSETFGMQILRDGIASPPRA